LGDPIPESKKDIILAVLERLKPLAEANAIYPIYIVLAHDRISTVLCIKNRQAFIYGISEGNQLEPLVVETNQVAEAWFILDNGLFHLNGLFPNMATAPKAEFGIITMPRVIKNGIVSWI
jgi:hypothetical protein